LFWALVAIFLGIRFEKKSNSMGASSAVLAETLNE